MRFTRNPYSTSGCSSNAVKIGKTFEAIKILEKLPDVAER